VSIRTRFTITVVAAIAITVVLFATLSIAVIDRALRSGFQSRLLTTAQAIAATIDVHHGRIEVDANDLMQLATLHADTPFSVQDGAERHIAGDTLATGAQGLEVLSTPVVRHGIQAGSVTVWQSDLWIADFDRDAAIVSLGVGLLLVGLGIMASRRAVTAALSPLERIALLAERIEGHDLESRLRADGSDELGRLCASFDRMLDRLQAAFARERRFVADASHELRAPLAVLRAETELALRRERNTEEYRAAFESILHEAMRLEELVDEMLAAARSEVESGERERIDAAELARRVGDRVRPAADLRGIDVRVETNGPAVARANSGSIERAMLAIVHNAIGFAGDNGVVRLAVWSDDAQVRIEIADDGSGFTPEALQHATERFWRGDGARSRGGTGLGLAIARTMVEANGGDLQLANAVDGGALVTIVLPHVPTQPS
jgi:signal transduction histidine kinase